VAELAVAAPVDALDLLGLSPHACTGQGRARFLYSRPERSRLVLALVLWLALGWRYGAAEILFELALGAAIWGGGGGKRVRRGLRELRRERLRLAPGHSA